MPLLYCLSAPLSLSPPEQNTSPRLEEEEQLPVAAGKEYATADDTPASDTATAAAPSAPAAGVDATPADISASTAPAAHAPIAGTAAAAAAAAAGRTKWGLDQLRSVRRVPEDLLPRLLVAPAFK